MQGNRLPLPSSSNTLQRLVFSNIILLGIQITLKVRAVHSSRWKTQKFNGTSEVVLFCFVLSHNALSGHLLLILQVVYIIWFLILSFLWDLQVSKCVCLFFFCFGGGCFVF